MGRWTQYEEDAHRLPEGFTRIAYDADTRRYTFRDRHGTIYHGAPDAEYGTLTPASSSPYPSTDRPVFDSDARPSLSLDTTGPAPTTFEEFVPRHLIASPSSSTSSPGSSPPAQSSRARFIGAVQRTALPKMQGVVSTLQRSVTSARRPSAGHAKGAAHNGGGGGTNGHGTRKGGLPEETRGLLNPSDGHGRLGRSASVATTRSSASTSSRMSVNVPPQRV